MRTALVFVLALTTAYGKIYLIETEDHDVEREDIPAVEEVPKHIGYKEEKCASEEEGIQCTLPFSYMGFTYHGCIKTIRTIGDKHWCVVKDEMAVKGFRRVNCTDSCPKAKTLSEVKLPPEEIVEKLKANQVVYSMIERGGDCEDY